MWTDLQNLAITIFYIYAAAYTIGFIVALIKNREVVKEGIVTLNKKTLTLDKCLVIGFLVLIIVACSGK